MHPRRNPKGWRKESAAALLLAVGCSGRSVMPRKISRANPVVQSATAENPDRLARSEGADRAALPASTFQD